MTPDVLRCALATLALVLAVPSIAAGALPASVTVYGDDVPPGTAERTLWIPGGGREIDATFDDDGLVWVRVHQPGGNVDGLRFGAPDGAPLTPGVYDGALMPPFVPAGRPAMDAHAAAYPGHDCNSGRFEVKDADIAGTAIRRLWIVYQSRCGSTNGGAFGEIRLGEPATPGPIATAPGVLRPVETEVGSPIAPMPVTVVASAPARITGAALTGADAGAFAVGADGCTGRTLAAGERCAIDVRYLAAAPGSRSATLQVTDASGAVASSVVQGFARGGRTRLTLQGTDADAVLQGRSVAYGPADGLDVAGERNRLDFIVARPDPDDFTGRFFAPAGGPQLQGAYATSSSAADPGAQFDLFGNGVSCGRRAGTFTIEESAYDANDFATAFSARFEQGCAGSERTLTGSLEYRAGDRTPPAPWMAGGQESPADPGTAPSPPAGGSPTAGRLRLARPKRQRLATVLRRGLRVVGTANGRVDLAVRRGTRRIGHRRLTAAGRFAVRVRLSRSARRALRHRRRAVKLLVVARGASTARAHVTVRR